MLSDYINTKLMETIEHINREIYYFETAYNRAPVAIMISHGLYDLIRCDRYNFRYYYDDNKDCNGVCCAYAGVPIEIYPSDKIEYYLAESKFTLD